MSKKKPKIMLHMHQLRDFIDDRYSFLNKYFRDIEPRTYKYKGIKKGFQMGNAVDFGIKQMYLNINKINQNTNKNNNINAGDNILNSQEFKTLPSKIDQTIAMALLNGYLDKYYSDKDTREYFINYQIKNLKARFVYKGSLKLKNQYTIYAVQI